MRRYLPYAVGALVLGLIGFLVYQTVQTEEQGRQALQQQGDPEHQEVDFRFQPIDFSAASTSRERFIQTADELDASGRNRADALLTARRQLGIINAIGSGRQDPWKLKQLRDQLGGLALEFHAQHGSAAWARLGERAYGDFLRALEARARAEKESPEYTPDLPGARLSAVLVGLAWRDSLSRLAWLSDFDVVAEAEGLLDEDGGIADGKESLVRLLFSYQWARLLGDELLLRRVMTSEEQVAFRRWQIEGSAAPLPRKLALVEQLRGKIENYDLDRTAAILHYQAGDRAAAREGLQRALSAARSRNDQVAIDEIEQLLEKLQENTK